MVNLYKHIRNISNFPKPGIEFKDITPLMLDPLIMEQTVMQLIDLIGPGQIDKVVAMESRGFFFGSLIASRLNAGFVPVRKANKLPFQTIQQEYGLEYGTDILEMHSDSISAGDRVLIHDDVLATGGTAEAVCKMVESLGGKIIELNFLMELTTLNGRNKLKGYCVKSILKYDI